METHPTRVRHHNDIWCNIMRGPSRQHHYQHHATSYDNPRISGFHRRESRCMVASRIKLTLAILLIATSAQAGHIHSEKAYRDEWCSRFNGETEVTLNDRTRVDCITENYVVELDFAAKWAECLGQALHYADLTGKRGACVLIIEHGKDWKHFKKLRHTARKHNIKAWYITPKQL